MPCVGTSWRDVTLKGLRQGATNHRRMGDGWWRDVELPDGRKLTVSVERGSPARGCYGVRGFKWFGSVREEGKGARCIGRVSKTAGAKSIIIEALLGGELRLFGEGE